LSFHIDSLPWSEIVAPCASLFLVVFFIDIVRWFGKFENSAEAVGSDLNLATFGFAADLLVHLMQGRPILPRWTFHMSVLVPVIAIFLGNLILYMVNLRLAKRIVECIAAKKNFFVIKGLKFISFSLGLISAGMFVGAQALWD
jgi:hypothetical protein